MKGLYITRDIYWQHNSALPRDICITAGTIYLFDTEKIFFGIESGKYLAGVRLQYYRTIREDEFEISPIRYEDDEISNIKKHGGGNNPAFREIDVNNSLVANVVALLRERESLPGKLEASVREICRSVR